MSTKTGRDQGTDSVMHQNISFTMPDNESLKLLVEVFQTHIQDLSLAQKDLTKAKAQISTIKSQLIDEPDPVIVNKAGRTLWNITEGAIGSLLAAAVQPSVWTVVYSILSYFK